MWKKDVKIEIVKPRIPKRVICSICGMRQKLTDRICQWTNLSYFCGCVQAKREVELLHIVNTRRRRYP